MLLSQIEIASDGGGAGGAAAAAPAEASPRLSKMRSGSLVGLSGSLSGKEKKRVLMRMGSEQTLQLLQRRPKASKV